MPNVIRQSVPNWAIIMTVVNDPALTVEVPVKVAPFLRKVTTFWPWVPGFTSACTLAVDAPVPVTVAEMVRRLPVRLLVKETVRASFGR